MVDLACVAALDDETDLGAGLLPDEVVVDGRGEQQGGNRRLVSIGVTIGQDHDAGTVRDRLADATADLGQPLGERHAAAFHVVKTTDGHRREPGHVPVVVDTDDLGEFGVADDRERQVYHSTRCRRRRQQITFGTERPAQARDHLLPDGVQGRVGHLREQLAEVVEEQPRTAREHRDRRVGAHRADRFDTASGHGRDDDAQFLLGVAEDLLAAADRGMTVDDVLAFG